MKVLFIICALLLSSMARAQVGAEITVKKQLSSLRDTQTQHSNAATAYSLGLVYGYYVQGKNTLGGDLAETLLSAQEKLKLNSFPSLENAIYGLSQLESGLSDSLFCLYRGITIGNYLAGKKQAAVVMNLTQAEQEHLVQTCLDSAN